MNKIKWKAIICSAMLVLLIALVPAKDAKADYTGLVQNENCWYYVNNGQVDYNYNGLVFDQNVGWWLVRDGAIDFGYNGLYCDPNYGWWLIQGGTVAFGYNGLYCDANCGWWLIQGGTVAFGYTGLYYDINYGWWLISGGTVAFGYNGLARNEYGWWCIQNGTVDFGRMGLVYDPFVGWWLVQNGTIAFDYSGWYNDANCGLWYINGGAVDTTKVNTKTDKERLRDGEYPLAPVRVNATEDNLKVVIMGYYYESGSSGSMVFGSDETIRVQGATSDEMHAKAKHILIDRGMDLDNDICHYWSGVACEDLGPSYDSPVYADEYTVYPDGHIEDAKSTFQRPREGDYMKLSNIYYPGLH